MMPAKSAHELTGRGVLAMFVGFFGIVFAVNAYFVTSAISTYTGVVAKEPYRKGLAYNLRIEADERQASLGWAANLTAERAGPARLALVTRDGAPVAGLVVTATVSRPSTDHFDRKLTFTETVPGHYETTPIALDGGSWIVALSARETAVAQPIFQLRRRLWLKP
jgi:nitrogen fixation protein FixH